MTVCLEKNCSCLGKLFNRFTVRVFHDYLSICMCASFPFGFEGRMWDMISLFPYHCLSFYVSFPLNSLI